MNVTSRKIPVQKSPLTEGKKVLDKNVKYINVKNLITCGSLFLLLSAVVSTY